MVHCENSLTGCPPRSWNLDTQAFSPGSQDSIPHLERANQCLNPSVPYFSNQTNLQPPPYSYHSTQSQPKVQAQPHYQTTEILWFPLPIAI